MKPKFPQVEVQLSEQDGNAFSIIARCTKAAKMAGVAKSDIDAFTEEAMSGDYNNVIKTAMKYFDVA